MFVTGTISREVGVPFTLTCTVTLSHRVRDSSISIQWQGPSTDEQTTVDRFSDIKSSVVYIQCKASHFESESDFFSAYTCTGMM